MATRTRIRTRGRWSLILGTIVAFVAFVAFAAVAYADDISNNLDASIDAAAEAMPLNVGGANGTTQLFVTPRNGDDKNGCNLTGSTTLGLSVSSSNTSVATVSPSSVTFTSCGDVKTLTVTPVTQGSATISVSQTSNDTGGTFNLAPATFVVNVAPPANTAPQVTVAGVTGGATYETGSVPAASCQVTDAEDGSSSFAAALGAVSGPNASDGIGNQTASCSYTDGGGLIASASETYSIVDPSAPSISYTLDPTVADGSNGWYRSNVSLNWTVSDAQSPNSLQKTGCVDRNITADQNETTYSCSATSAGGTASSSVTIKRDATDPTISADAGAYPPGEWTNQTVTITFTCWDATSQLLGACPAAVAVSTSTPAEGQNISGSTSDNAGNTASSDPINVKVDKTAPTISGSRLPPANASGWNNANVVVSFSCDDAPSGLASCGPTPVTVASEGENQSVSGTAVDKAGNSTSDTVSGISIDKTDPTVACGSAPTAWSNLDVSIACTATDELSGLASSSDASFSLSTSVDAGEETDNASTGSRGVSDKAGNSKEAGPVTGVKVDKKAPTYSCATPSAAWSATDVSIDCTAADGGSGLDPAGDAAFTLSTSVASGHETSTATTGSKFLADAVGNSTTAQAITGLKIDKKAPVVSCGSADGVWHGSNVSIACTAADGGSGLASSADASFSLATTVAAGAENGNAATGAKTVTDAVGNSATGGPISGNKIDRKAPVVTLTCPTTPVLLGSNYSGSWSATDGGSGVATGFAAGVIPLNTSTVGANTAVVPAGASKDNVDNMSAEKTCGYSVVYGFDGFAAPVNRPNTVNVSKAGQAIPLKWRLTDASGVGITTLTSVSVIASSVGCTAGATDDLLEEYAAGSSGLQNLGDGYYQFNWKTPTTYANSCKTIGLNLGEGATRPELAFFSFKK